ncbi:hypothetical protein [Amycolatopsis sp. CA-230715]|uniref:hypothetical protein n=1 Tax=Amycolatopsis sp. CA-230715 TaxID=2745196 RepID=UPI001C0374C0|nr:hypothetical protein [Amycolatopsis sp. CA-230715]QWF78017.1 hypothetical protein HUW46_01410 [Amycolatopsis sp. CA-230715]
MADDAAQPRILLIDAVLPHHHFELVRHRIADAPAPVTYAAARELDYTEVRGGIASLATWVRAIPERRMARQHGLPRVPTRMTIDDMTTGSAWSLLGERPGQEFAIGAVGKFWRPVVDWRELDDADFDTFDEPGYGKVVMAIATRPYGPHRALLTVHSRVQLTDPASWVKFRRYWRIASPFIGSVHTAILMTIAENARKRALDEYVRDPET